MSIQQVGTGIASAPPSAIASPAGFRDPTTLTRWLTILIWTSAALALVGIVSTILEIKLLSDFQAGQTLAPGEAESNDARQQMIAIARLPFILATVVVFAIWIYRAGYNARQLGAAGMQFSPGWAVGWYFIPILNLWKPYQAMKEIWKASAAPAGWQEYQRGPILPLWWGFFLFSNFLNNASFRISLFAKEIPQIVGADILATVADAVDIVASLIALALVRQIYRMQMWRNAASIYT